MSAVLSVLLAAVLVVCGVGIIVCCWALVRNERVYRFRTDMLRQIHEASGRDIDAGRDYQWRYQTYQMASYDQMMRHFWKPLTADAWYDDSGFLR